MWKRWGFEPLYFAKEALGFEPTDQQESYFLEVGKLFRAKVKRFKNFVMDEEEKIYADKKIGISIRSAQGPGKDAVAAITIIWWQSILPKSRMFCTAPDATTLENVLWAEVSKWLNRTRADGSYYTNDIIREGIIVQQKKIFRTQGDKAKDGKEYFAEARTANAKASPDEQARTLRGRHLRHMIVMVDEASEVLDSVMTPIITTMTQEINFALLFWNPIRTKGFAYNTHFGPHEVRDLFINLHWSALDSPIVTKQSIEVKKSLYGENSNEYRISVLGEPPISDDSTLILHEWIYEAKGSYMEPDENQPLYLGVDCAGMGNDKDVLCARQGGKVYDLSIFDNLNTIEIANWAVQKAYELSATDIMVDSIGIGAGVYDQIRVIVQGQGVRVHPVNVAREARNKKKFMRLRDELWWNLRTQFESSIISIPDDRILMGQLSDIKYEPGLNGRIKVEGKKEMKKRLSGSPDRADALMLTYYLDSAIKSRGSLPRQRYEKAIGSSINYSDTGWMVM